MPKHEPEILEAMAKKFKGDYPEVEPMQKAIIELRNSLRRRLGKQVVVKEMTEIILASLFAYVYGRQFENALTLISVATMVDDKFHKMHDAVLGQIAGDVE